MFLSIRAASSFSPAPCLFSDPRRRNTFLPPPLHLGGVGLASQSQVPQFKEAIGSTKKKRLAETKEAAEVEIWISGSNFRI
ncbi:uncharacterized protein DS421_4g116170 [Arachis hypogaea]|nr:uncharacterized protein DS421_4g116170 [Arachis hypogaea]